MTAAAAIEGIRETDPSGTIGLISAETDPPYKRPPLSKGLWKGDALDSIWLANGKNTAEFHLNLTVKAIDPGQKKIICVGGEEFSYEKLLLATGVRPRRLEFDNDSIVYYRTLSDYRNLRKLTETGNTFAVIGGGFIGSEIAAALTLAGKHVTMIFPGAGIGDRLFPSGLSQFLNQFYKQKGIEVLSGEKILSLKKNANGFVINTTHRSDIAADAVVAGIGSLPNIELAQSATINTQDGIIVDEFLKTNQKDIYAAGDVAVFYNPSLKKQLRVEHEDNANTMGRLAGINMAGKAEPYHHLPFFYSDMFELGYEAVGEVDSRLEIYADWKQEFKEGVVYYLKNGQVRGVLLWNVWNQVDEARALIAEPGPFKAEDLKGRLK
ncbi:MAG: NAD(P)/FAD-dependent oxidoreductase [Ignavibacteriae bacterium]|nr:MAG: NAD(P)/FAD-dependent oxidoreductase [Ignavibacteriota bacterium]